MENFALDDRIVAVASVEEACTGVALIIHALPAQGTPDFIREHRAVIPPEAIFCTTSKGLYLAGRWAAESLVEFHVCINNVRVYRNMYMHTLVSYGISLNIRRDGFSCALLKFQSLCMMSNPNDPPPIWKHKRQTKGFHFGT